MVVQFPAINTRFIAAALETVVFLDYKLRYGRRSNKKIERDNRRVFRIIKEYFGYEIFYEAIIGKMEQEGNTRPPYRQCYQ